MILVTGATGFVGSNLCKRLVMDDYQVCGISHSGNTCRVKSIMGRDNFCLKIGDIRDTAFVVSLFMKEKFDAVFHIAAQVPYANEEKDFSGINVRGTLNLIKSAHANKVAKFIYASSMSVYSKPEYLPVDEAHPTFPLDIYGRSKLSGELCCKLYTYGTKIAIMRFAGIYGYGSENNRVIPSFVRSALNGEPLMVDGDGSHSSDFVLVDDVVQGMLFAWEKGKGVYNLGSGRETSLKELAEMVIELTSSNSKVVFNPDGVSRPFQFYLDISKAERELGYHPRLLKDGLKAYINAVS